MYVLTFFFVLGWSWKKTMQYAEAHLEETGVKLPGSEKFSYFCQKAFVILLFVWAAESYLYWKILTMDPTP